MDKNLIIKLRQTTSAGMLDCQKALKATNGDFQEAIDWLRQKGMSAASKKSGRTTSEGIVGVATNAERGVMVEINCETDFLARNEKFQDFVRSILTLGLSQGPETLEDLCALSLESGQSVEESRLAAIGVLQENIQIRRWVCLQGPAVHGYVHNALCPQMGTLGVLVSVDGAMSADLARGLSMHIAALAPQALSKDTLSADIIERERHVLQEQLKSIDKPQAVINKMLEGRLNKFFSENTLLSQAYVRDAKTTVEALLKANANTVHHFVRYQRGEDI